MPNTVQIIRVQRPDALYRHYDGQTEQQPCHVWLDIRDGQLGCDYNPEIGNAIPMAQYHGLILTAPIPCLTADAANTFLDSIAELAQRVLDGATEDWNGSNHVGVYTDDARTAWDTIAEKADPENFENQHLVVGWTAADWFFDGVERLITVDTTDEELVTIARDECETARTSSDYGYSILDEGDAYIWLAACRTEMRDKLFAELEDEAYTNTTQKEALKAQIAQLDARRDAILYRVHRWSNYKTSRVLGEMFGVSHTAVLDSVRTEAARIAQADTDGTVEEQP